MNSRQVGNRGEDMAVRYLQLRFYKILERNYRTASGEIDIIAKKGNTYVFVEVKYRSNVSKGMPREAVTVQKQEKIRRTAQHYLATNNINENSTDIRFDVIEILGQRIEHLKACF
jgi:putative endonuclease